MCDLTSNQYSGYESFRLVQFTQNILLKKIEFIHVWYVTLKLITMQLPPGETEEEAKKRGFNTHGYNARLADTTPLNRHVSDMRHPMLVLVENYHFELSIFV